MHSKLQTTRLLAGALLLFSLLLSACSITGDDDDDSMATATDPDAVASLTQTETDDMESTANSPESTMTDDAGAQSSPDVTSEASEEATSISTTEATAAATDDDAGSESEYNLMTRVEEVTNEVRPAVAFIAITQVVEPPTGESSEQEGVGSGVIFDDEGHILTNNHVVEGADELQVVLPDGRQFDATVLGRAPSQDIAVIKIEGDDLPVATLAGEQDLEIGQWVIAIGNALGLEGGASVTVGVVSALDRTLRPSQQEPPIEGLIQTDAAINPGNSGGPLVNLDGEVVGINTAKIPQAEGIGFAVPVTTARMIIDQIMTGEPQATLGVSVANVTPEVAVRFNLSTNSGVLVVDTNVDGPAATAGIQTGDIITQLDGEPIEDLDDLRASLDSYNPGDTVTVTVNRGGQVQDIDVELGESIVIQ